MSCHLSRQRLTPTKAGLLIAGLGLLPGRRFRRRGSTIPSGLLVSERHGSAALAELYRRARALYLIAKPPEAAAVANPRGSSVAKQLKPRYFFFSPDFAALSAFTSTSVAVMV